MCSFSEAQAHSPHKNTKRTDAHANSGKGRTPRSSCAGVGPGYRRIPALRSFSTDRSGPLMETWPAGGPVVAKVTS